MKHKAAMEKFLKLKEAFMKKKERNKIGKRRKNEVTRSYWEQRASLLGARTLLGAPGLTTSNKKLLVARSY